MYFNVYAIFFLRLNKKKRGLVQKHSFFFFHFLPIPRPPDFFLQIRHYKLLNTFVTHCIFFRIIKLIIFSSLGTSFTSLAYL